MADKIVFSNNQEVFNDNSIEEAIEACEADENGLVTIWQGEATKPPISRFIDAGTIIEQMAERAMDEFSDYAECWLEHVPKEQIEELDNELSKILEQWAAKHEQQPNFYSVNNIKEISIRFLDDKGNWERVE